MPALTDQAMKYSPRSLEVIRQITERLEDMLGEQAMKRAKADGRNLVTGENVLATFEEEFLRKLVPESGHGG